MKINIRSFLICIAFILSMALISACGAQENGGATGPSDGSAQDSAASDETTVPSESDVAPLDREIVLGTTTGFPPFEFTKDAEHPGLDIELAEKISDYLGLPLKIQYTDRTSVLTGVRTGQFDIGIAAIIPKYVHDDKLEFSDQYATGRFVALSGTSSDITSKDDLSAATIGVISSMPAEEYSKKAFPKAKLTSFDSADTAVSAMKNGETDCIVIDELSALIYAATDGDLGVTEIDSPGFSYSLALAKGNTDLLTDVNEALLVLKQNGVLDELLKKYDATGNSFENK